MAWLQNVPKVMELQLILCCCIVHPLWLRAATVQYDLDDRWNWSINQPHLKYVNRILTCKHIPLSKYKIPQGFIIISVRPSLCGWYCIVPRCSVTLAPPPWKQIVRYESNKPIKSKSTYRQSINQSSESLQRKSTLDWLIDLIHCRKNCPTGMISGWVQQGTQHDGIKQNYFLKTLHIT